MKKQYMINTKSTMSLLAGHRLLHSWWKNPERTSWSKNKIREKHSELVKIMKSRGIKHNSPLK